MSHPCLGIPGRPRCLELARRGPRCAACTRELEAPQRAVYDDRRWRRLRRRRIREHLERYGPWCPGWGVPAHVSWDLTLDHIVPFDQGGAPFADDNVFVGCRGCNDRKGGQVGGWNPLREDCPA